MSEVENPRRLRGRLLTIFPVAIFALIGAGFYWGLFNGDDALPSPLIGKIAPEFDLPPIEGRSDGLATADLKGKVSIVNVWASWCVPCRVEMPLLNELAARDEIAIFGINYKDRPESALGFLAELGDPYTQIGADRDGRVSIDWGVYGVPETYVIDAEGRIAYKHIGPFDRASLENEILQIVRRLQGEPRS